MATINMFYIFDYYIDILHTTQFQLTENACDLWDLAPNIYKCLKIEDIFYFELLVMQWNICFTFAIRL